MKDITIVRAEIMGFCMGVRRAVDKAVEISETRKGSSIFTLGPLIHNRLCIEDLAARGVKTARVTEEIHPGDTVIIRTHGIPPSQRMELERIGADVIDATCPRVLRSQKIVKSFSEKNYYIVIVGDRNHGEITGLAGFARSSSVIQNETEAGMFSYDESLFAGLAVISQTTLRQEEYDAIGDIIRMRYPSLEKISSICPATRQRQESLMDLAGSVDAIVIVGGKNSANTIRLYTTALTTGKPVLHIEDAGELTPEIASFDRIGITAGASTPDDVVADVEKAIRAFAGGS